jgi:hypothetical protein
MDVTREPKWRSAVNDRWVRPRLQVPRQIRELRRSRFVNVFLRSD